MRRKPVILLDCDGVLADFTSLALKVIEEETGKLYSAEDIPRWDIFESLGYPELWTKFEKKVCQPGFCSNMKAYPAALPAVKKLRENYEILIVTAPIDSPPWMYERAHWIEDIFEIPRRKVIFAHEKQHVQGDALIDDKPENVIDWAAANPNRLAVLWEHSYNRNFSLPAGIVRTSNWDDLQIILAENFER